MYSQYGLKEHPSAKRTVIELTDRMYEVMDQWDNPISIFLDLSKAFDMLNHFILSNKLKYYGLKKMRFVVSAAIWQVDISM